MRSLPGHDRATCGIVLALLAGAGCRLHFDEIADAAACGTLTIAVPAQTNINTRETLAASGGNPPYTFSGVGVSGTEFSSTVPLDSTVTVTDSAGCTASAPISTVGDALFLLGGEINGSIIRADIWRSTDAHDWQIIGSLPSPRETGGVVIFENRIWYFGGYNGSSYFSDILTSTDGITFTPVGSLPFGVADTAAVVYHGALYLVGGHGNPGAVWKSTDGISWQKIAELGVPVHGGNLVVLADQMLYIGGHDDVMMYDTVYASIDGVAWTVRSHLPAPREFAEVELVGDTLWYAGGQGMPSVLDDVLTTTDGLTWSRVGTLPVPRGHGSMVRFRGRQWMVGGDDGGPIWSGTDPSAWTTEPSTLTFPREYTTVLAFHPH